MRLAVFGLGYVGAMTAAGMTRFGHTVAGVDLNPDKVSAVTEGRAPVREPGLDDIIREQVQAGRLTATTDGAAAMDGADLAFVCVGTPSHPDGAVDLSQITRVTRDIGDALKGRAASTHPCLIAYRSTLLPGTIEDTCAPLLETAAGAAQGTTWRVACNPEFMREGSSVEDFMQPVRTLIGAADDDSRTRLAAVWKPVTGEPVCTDIRSAEFIKYADNAFHAMKAAFANDIAAAAHASGVDGRRVMSIVAADTRLNISPAYLTPGAPFGGSCLPKDLRALVTHAEHSGVAVPLFAATHASNDAHLARILARIDATVDGPRDARVALLGLAFKPGTDDLRESPGVAVYAALTASGYRVRCFDPDVVPGELIGANVAVYNSTFKEAALSESLDDAVREADIIVVMTGHPAFTKAAPMAGDTPVLDVAGVFYHAADTPRRYLTLA